MKAQLMSLMLTLLTSSFAFAGAANADLDCKSKDLTIKGSVPGDFAEFALTLNFKGKTGQLESTTEGSSVHVYEEPAEGVWTMLAHGKDGYVRMHAIPKTMKFKALPGSGYNATFSAKVRTEFGHPTQRAESTVVCTLHYSL